MSLTEYVALGLSIQKSKQLKWSLALATYERQDVLLNCIEMTLRQSYPASEIIIVDGGSTDQSVDIIRKYGVFMMPAVVVDGAVKVAGKVPGDSDLLSWLTPAG